LDVEGERLAWHDDGLMKKLSIFILCAAILALAGVAVAKVDKKLLVGKWTGEMHVSFSGAERSEKVAMEFKRDGTLLITSGDNDKVDKGTYEIKGSEIALKDAKSDMVIMLTDVTLTKSKLSGNLEPGDDSGMPAGAVMKLVLSRVR
jgi:uncharacterized protein (TIGR03066 family)